MVGELVVVPEDDAEKVMVFESDTRRKAVPIDGSGKGNGSWAF
jgi:hypothetical protein